MGLLGHMENVGLSLYKAAKLFFKVLCHFTFLLATSESSSFCTSVSAVGIINLFNFSYCSWYVVVSHCYLICLFLITSDIEHIFIYFQVFIFFSEISIHIKSIFILGYKNSLYVLETRPLTYMSFSKYFFQVCGFHFYFLILLFLRTEILNFEAVQFISFFFYILCFLSPN